jgi:uncharacterized protein (TIRG00374 family)
LKSTTRKYVEFGAFSFLAIAILWWFGRHLDWAEVRGAVGRANPYLLLLALVVICSTYFLRSARWGALLAPLSPASMRNLFIATTVGFGALFLLGRMGEVVRPLVLPMRDPKIRPSASFVTIMVERIYDMLAIVVFFAANLIWMKPPANSAVEFNRVRFIGVFMLVAVLFGVFLMTLFRKNSQTVIDRVKKILDRGSFIPSRVTRAVISILEQLARALRVLVNARELAVTIGWTVLLWVGIALGNWLVLRAFGLPFGITETVFVMGWALVGSLVPTPGGAAGAFHAATAGALIFLGIGRETAAAISIVLHLVDFGPALIIGLVYILRGDVNISNLRAITSSETVEHAIEDEPILPDEDYGRRELKAVAARD